MCLVYGNVNILSLPNTMNLLTSSAKYLIRKYLKLLSTSVPNHNRRLLQHDRSTRFGPRKRSMLLNLFVFVPLALLGGLCTQGFDTPTPRPGRFARTNIKFQAQSYICDAANSSFRDGTTVYDKCRPSATICGFTSFIKPFSCPRARQPNPASTALRLAPEGFDVPCSLIEKQKARALQLWEERCSEGALDASRFVDAINLEQTDESVRHDLKNGLVPPIFHAVVNSGTPLFSTTIHKLSPDPVSAGTSAENTEALILSSLCDPYDVLFAGNPLVANSRVLDEAILPKAWVFDKKATNAVAQLVNTKAIMLGADVESTDGLETVLFRDKSAQAFSLLTRPQSRGVVASCFHSSETDSSLAITGSPGIGKSWTLLYALQQALLYENAIVVYILRKDNRAFLCVRRNQHVHVWRAEAVSYVSLFGHEDVLVLFDPLEAARNGADFDRGERMLIFAASNNKAHFDGGIYKVQTKPERFLGHWMQDELAVALPVVAPTLSLAVALARASEVGMLLRYIMNDAFFQERKRQTEIALDRLENVLKKTIQFDGINEKGVTVPGTIFAVGPALMAIGGANEEGENTVIEVPGESDSDAEESNARIQPDLGYEGQFVNYTERVLTFMTEQTLTEIVRRGRKLVIEFWGKTCKEGAGVQMGFAVENLFADDLQKLVASVGFELPRWLQEGRADIGPESRLIVDQKCSWSTEPITLAGLSRVFEDGKTVGQMKQRSGLIDFVGPGRKVYQVTVGLAHKMNLNSLITVLVQAGFLLKTEGRLELATVHVPEDKLEFYWVVPSLIKENWKKKVPYNPNLKASAKADLTYEDKKVLQDCLSKYVVQYVLVLEE
jgi:hypothetical protein